MTFLSRARGRSRAATLSLTASVAMSATLMAALPGLPASAAQATTTTVKPASTTPVDPSPATTVAGTPTPPSPTTTIAPWDPTPKGPSTPGTAPIPPAPPTATKPAASASPGFDPAKSVLIEAETTPTKAVYANPDGTRTAKISTAAARFKDSAGKWADFDLSLITRPDGSLGAKAAPNAATLATKADGSVVTAQTSAGPVTLRHPDASAVAARVDQQGATYAKALPGGRDLKVVPTPDGFEESVVLPDAKSPASYREELTLPVGVTARDATAGGIELVDKTGTVIATFGSGFAYDASSSGGILPTPVSVRVVSQVGRVAVIDVRIADPAWLTSPGRVFPVTIDPVFAQSTSPGYGGHDAQIIDGSYANTSFPGFQPLQVGGGTGTYHYRSMFGFDLSSLAGATVTAAQVYLYNLSSGPTNNCTPRAVSIYGLGGPFNSATTWNTQPPLDAYPPVVPPAFAHSTAAGSTCPSDWVALDITAMTQRWVSGTPNYGIQLRTDEVDINVGQVFWSGNRGPNVGPFIYVTLNDRVANPPTNVVATPNADGSVGVTWTAPTPNGGSPVDFYLLYALNPDLSYAGSYAIAYPPATSATLGGLDRSRPYVIGVFPHNAMGYSLGVSAQLTTAAEPLARAGAAPWFSYDGFGLNDRLGAQVNIGTGNLMVGATDLTLPTVGGSRSLGRTYNSLAKDASSALFGYGWRFSEAPDHRLEILYDGSARYWSPSGNATVFGNGVPNATPWTLSTPPGIDATLVRNADATFTLTVHGSAEVLTFRSDGLMTSDADRYGNTVTFAYAPNWPTSIAGTAGSTPGNTANIAYGGPGGKVSTMTQTADGVTRTVSYTYDAAGNLWKVTDARGGVTTFLYDAAHRMTSIAGPGSGNVAQVTTFGYDAANRVTSVTRAIPGDTTAVTGYDYSTANMTKVTDADGHPPVTYSIDALGRVISISDPKNPDPGAATNVNYSPSYFSDNKVQSVRNALGGTTTNVWGANGGESLTSVTDPTEAQSVSSYANTGSLAWAPDWVKSTLGNKTAVGYNGTVPDPRTVQNVGSSDFRATLYNTDGTVSSSTDPENVSTLLPDILGQDTTRSTRYTYFPTHQLQTVTPPVGTNLGAQSFTYDGAGRLKTATSARGVTATFAYDALDRVVGQTFSDPTPALSMVYDANANMTSRTDASGTTTWVYDAIGRLRTKTLPGGAVLAYAYDPVGNLISANDAGVITTYSYNKVNELDQLNEPSGRKDVFAYNAAHQRTDAWLGATYTGGGNVRYDATGNVVVAPSGFAVHMKSFHDNAGNLIETRTTHASSDATGDRLADISYSYAVPAGTPCAGVSVGTKTNKRQASTDLVANKTTYYCYDSAERLIGANTTGGPVYTYGYDKNSNRRTDAAGTHTFNAVNQLTDAGYAYDPDGNMTASPAFPNVGTAPVVPGLVYNGVGQTTSITPAGQSATGFTYAGLSQDERTSAGATTAQNGMLGIESETTGGVTTSYVRGPGGGLIYQHSAAGDFYYYFDGLGSVIGLVDATTGDQRAAYTYDPYGANATATGVNGALPANPWRWVGGYLDAATGLYHFGARYYDPTTGRFTQVDPVEGGSCNDYDYVCGDPVNDSDLNGRCGLGNPLKACGKNHKGGTNILSGAASRAGELYQHAEFSIGGCVGACLGLGFQGGHGYGQVGVGCCFAGGNAGYAFKPYEDRACTYYTGGGEFGIGLYGDSGAYGGVAPDASDIAGGVSAGAGFGGGRIRNYDLPGPGPQRVCK